MINSHEIAGMSGGASGHFSRDTQRSRAGSASIFATTIFRPTPSKIASSRPAALRSGIHSGESRSEVGHAGRDTQDLAANLAPFPASAGALPATRTPTPILRPPEAHHSAHRGGGSASTRATPIDGPPISPFPLRRG